jgi:hypothetical protein
VTLANALFVVAGVTLMVLLEWGHHRLDEWWVRLERKEKAMFLAFLTIVLAGILILALALVGGRGGN